VRTVLVTGATGAIGSVLAKYLLEEKDTRVRLLLRARTAAHLDERLGALCRFWNLGGGNGHSERLQAVAGDVTLPNLGLEESMYRRLSSEVTHLIHSAGDVHLNRPIDQARKSAVDSARQIVSFADACAVHGTFAKLEFISTVGVAGNMAGTVPEAAFGHGRIFRNSYEMAKAEAEAFLLKEMTRGLPATIHRPSMVVGDSKDGTIIQFQVFYHLCEFLSGKRTAGIIPNAGEIRLDIVPVDYVARAIQKSSACRESTGRIFHLCAGPSQAPKIDDLAQRVHRIFASHGRRLPSMRPVPVAVIRALLPAATWLTAGRARKSLQTLPYFLAYLDKPQTFENFTTEEFFSVCGLTVPAVDTYLDTVLAYYLARTASPSESLKGAS
jgi:thioester reductase-like protein